MNFVSSYLSTRNTNKDSIKSLYFKKSYTNIINDLRDHWQSPISYLKKRGYLPELKNEPDISCVKLTEDENENNFNTQMEDNNNILNLKIDNYRPDLKKRQSSVVTNQKPLTNSLAGGNYQGNLATTDDKQSLTNSLAGENSQGMPAKADDKLTLSNSLAGDNYQDNLAKSDDKQPLTNSLVVENDQGNLVNSLDKQVTANNLAVDPVHLPSSPNRLVAVENVQGNPTKLDNKQPSINSLAVEKVLENLSKTDDKQTATKDFLKNGDTGFFTNMKHKFMGLFSRSELDNPIKMKHTKLLKELEKDIQKELNKGTLTKTYAQKAVQTMVSNEYNYLENDLQKNYDNSFNKYQDKIAFGPN